MRRSCGGPERHIWGCLSLSRPPSSPHRVTDTHRPSEGAPTTPPLLALPQALRHLSPQTICLKASGHLQITEVALSAGCSTPLTWPPAGRAAVQRDYSRCWQKAEKALLGADPEPSPPQVGSLTLTAAVPLLLAGSPGLPAPVLPCGCMSPLGPLPAAAKGGLGGCSFPCHMGKRQSPDSSQPLALSLPLRCFSPLPGLLPRSPPKASLTGRLAAGPTPDPAPGQAAFP